MNNKQLVGIFGVILLFIGAFSPMLHIPIRGSITYINNGTGDGMFVLLLAFLAAYYLWKNILRKITFQKKIVSFVKIVFYVRVTV